MGTFTPLTNKQFTESEMESRHSLSIIWCVKLSPNLNSNHQERKSETEKNIPIKNL